MASPPFKNEYNLRTVADVSSKSCFVCHRSTPKVLITEDSKDFFYICASHLTDRGFATPIVDAKVEAEKKEAELREKEKEAIIKEYDEKLKKKGKKKEDKKENEIKDIEKEKEEKLKAVDSKPLGSTAADDDIPKQYNLHRNFYQMRLDRKQNIERAKRDQQRLQNPNFFPAAPKNDLT